jgi:hypothetical protein
MDHYLLGGGGGGALALYCAPLQGGPVWVGFGQKKREKLENAFISRGSTRENASPTFFPSKMPSQAM